MSNGIERNVNIEIVREQDHGEEDALHMNMYEESEAASGSVDNDDTLSEAITDSGAPVVPPPTKKTRWTKKKQELAKKAEMEAMGIQQKLPLTALSRRELRDMGLDTKTIDHIRNQAKALNDIKKAEIDAETEMAALEVQKKKLALEQEKARVAELTAELERARRALRTAPFPVEEEYPQHHPAPMQRKPIQSMMQAQPQVAMLQPQQQQAKSMVAHNQAQRRGPAPSHVDAQALFY
jgi:hypothetical protein